jgi:hypothetical protein
MSKEFVINYKDFYGIVGVAKDNMAKINLPIHISKNKMKDGEIPSIAIAESLISYLNNKGLLKELVKLDYTVETDEREIPDLEDEE